jgi:hypothetical protein
LEVVVQVNQLPLIQVELQEQIQYFQLQLQLVAEEVEHLLLNQLVHLLDLVNQVDLEVEVVLHQIMVLTFQVDLVHLIKVIMEVLVKLMELVMDQEVEEVELEV